VIPYGVRVPAAARRVANCCTPFTRRLSTRRKSSQWSEYWSDVRVPVESSLDICRLGAELAVQSQQRRWDDRTRHSQLQPTLSSAGTDRWVLSWRRRKEVVQAVGVLVDDEKREQRQAAADHRHQPRHGHVRRHLRTGKYVSK